MNKKQIMCFACGLLLVFFIPRGYADESNLEARSNWKEKKEGKIFEKLHLTEDQRNALKANKQKQRALKKASFQQMKSLRESLHQALMNKELDMNQINSIHGQLKTLMNQMADNRLNSIIEVRKILTPDQFVQFLELINERHQRFKQKLDSEHHEDKSLL